MRVRCERRGREVDGGEEEKKRVRSEDKNSVVAGRVTGLGMPTRGRQYKVGG